MRVFRRKDESWVEFMRRSARKVEDCDKRFGLRPWTQAYKTSKWKFAGQLARHTDGRWSSLVYKWRPIGYRRSPGRPVTRWEDELVKYAGGYWNEIAVDTARWKDHEPGFIM